MPAATPAGAVAAAAALWGAPGGEVAPAVGAVYGTSPTLGLVPEAVLKDTLGTVMVVWMVVVLVDAAGHEGAPEHGTGTTVERLTVVYGAGAGAGVGAGDPASAGLWAAGGAAGAGLYAAGDPAGAGDAAGAGL